MRIHRTVPCLPPYKLLRSFNIGTIVNLKSRLARDTNANDPILIVNMQSYRLYSGNGYPCENTGKVAVLNLNNNRLSYIDNKREAFEINAEVCIL